MEKGNKKKKKEFVKAKLACESHIISFFDIDKGETRKTYLQ